jgi:hypothetical protein
MAKTAYCWRCKIEVPMLDEREWEQVYPRLSEGLRAIKEYRERNGATLVEAMEHFHGQGAIERYFEITGFRETNANAIWHHRLSLFGPRCAACGKLLRTPRAKLCAACGAAVGSASKPR